MTRIEKLKARIALLENNRAAELASEDVSERYISDLDDSINNCKTELKFLEKNPGGVQMVNGG